MWKKVPHCGTFKRWNIISFSHGFWTHCLIVSCIGNCLSYLLGHSIIYKLIAYKSIYLVETIPANYAAIPLYIFILWHALLSPSCWMPYCRHWFFANIFFKCFTLLKSLMSNHKSYKNNRFRLTFIKININKVNIIKIFTKNIYFTTKNVMC